MDRDSTLEPLINVHVRLLIFEKNVALYVLIKGLTIIDFSIYVNQTISNFHKLSIFERVLIFQLLFTIMVK